MSLATKVQNEDVEQLAHYLAEAFGGDVPLWKAGADCRQVHSAMDHAPAGILHMPTAVAGDLNVAFQGANIAILENNHRPLRTSAPPTFRVVALMPTYNEADIIRASLQYLIHQGIEVYIVDNWSTDGTFELARELDGHGLIGIERFPAAGPVPTYEWRSILGRLETLAAKIDADWFLFHDADERRHSPWPDVDLRSALHYADRSGFNCVDHMVLNFHPTPHEQYTPGSDVEEQLHFFEWSDHEGHFHQRKAWKNLGYPVALASTAGHDIRYPGRLVYPFKFLMKHYPIRSQAHGERKVFQDRAKRWSAEERALGWHKQYDGMEPNRSFLRDPSTLLRFDDTTFYDKYLVERLSGIGVFKEAPWWATGARQQF